MPRLINGRRDLYWAKLRVAGGRLKGHIWSHGDKFQVDAALPASPHGFVALCLDGQIRTFEPDDVSLPRGPEQSPLVLRAHIYQSGEIIESVATCVACGRTPEDDEPADAAYDGEPVPCTHCARLARLYKQAHEATVETNRLAAAGDHREADTARQLGEQVRRDITQTASELDTIHRSQYARIRQQERQRAGHGNTPNRGRP